MKVCMRIMCEFSPYIFAKVKTKLPTIVLLLIDIEGVLEITENVSFLRKLSKFQSCFHP